MSLRKDSNTSHDKRTHEYAWCFRTHLYRFLSFQTLISLPKINYIRNHYYNFVANGITYKFLKSVLSKSIQLFKKSNNSADLNRKIALLPSPANPWRHPSWTMHLNPTKVKVMPCNSYYYELLGNIELIIM